ncbi:invasion associated locus B family protein [Novosphingobium resinovorum]|nr:invasion associated locus B family protein [Novosphingobium resinovorum]
MTVERGGHACRWPVLAIVAALFLTGDMAVAAEPSAAPPHERHGDWEVVCAVAGKATKCSAVQRQATTATSGHEMQRVLAMELVAVPDGAVGTLLTPFGVDLASGLVLKLNTSGPPLPFKTCLPSGCVVPLQFGKEAVRSLRKETLLRISFVTAGDGRRIDLPVSLKGLGQALDRAGVLAGTSR